MNPLVGFIWAKVMDRAKYAFFFRFHTKEHTTKHLATMFISFKVFRPFINMPELKVKYSQSYGRAAHVGSSLQLKVISWFQLFWKTWNYEESGNWKKMGMIGKSEKNQGVLWNK